MSRIPFPCATQELILWPLNTEESSLLCQPLIVIWVPEKGQGMGVIRRDGIEMEAVTETNDFQHPFVQCDAA